VDGVGGETAGKVLRDSPSPAKSKELLCNSKILLPLPLSGERDNIGMETWMEWVGKRRNSVK
jgi:hypothetical protein